MKIKWFRYSNIFTNISEDDFEVFDWDRFIFDEEKYCKNCLIWVHWMFRDQYIYNAKTTHNKVLWDIFIFNEKKLKTLTDNEKIYIYKFLSTFSKKS